jgi:hypothetical protein
MFETFLAGLKRQPFPEVEFAATFQQGGKTIRTFGTLSVPFGKDFWQVL